VVTKTSPLLTQIRHDLRRAMQAHDQVAIHALRTLLDALDNACAVELTSEHVEVYGRLNEVPRKVITEAEYQALLQAEADARRSAAEEYERIGQLEAARRVRAELAIILRYTHETLP
jgi:hypothetical protein